MVYTELHDKTILSMSTGCDIHYYWQKVLIKKDYGFSSSVLNGMKKILHRYEKNEKILWSQEILKGKVMLCFVLSAKTGRFYICIWFLHAVVMRQLLPHSF